jgi:hypothetical protein
MHAHENPAALDFMVTPLAITWSAVFSDFTGLGVLPCWDRLFARVAFSVSETVQCRY